MTKKIVLKKTKIKINRQNKIILDNKNNKNKPFVRENYRFKRHLSFNNSNSMRNDQLKNSQLRKSLFIYDNPI